MRLAIVFLVGLLFLGTHGSARAQAEADTDSVLSPRNGPIRMLLDRREQMGLTAEQVARLEAIQARVEERNSAPVQRFMEIRRRWERERPADWRRLPPARRREIRERFQSAIREESRGLGEQVQRNNQEAMLQVRAVLTEAQRQRLRRFLGGGRLGAPAGAGEREGLRAPSR